jgi:hypothetical protein
LDCGGNFAIAGATPFWDATGRTESGVAAALRTAVQTLSWLKKAAPIVRSGFDAVGQGRRGKASSDTSAGRPCLKWIPVHLPDSFVLRRVRLDGRLDDRDPERIGQNKSQTEFAADFREAGLVAVSAVNDRFNFRTYELVAIHCQLQRYAKSVPIYSRGKICCHRLFSEKTVSDNCNRT